MKLFFVIYMLAGGEQDHRVFVSRHAAEEDFLRIIRDHLAPETDEDDLDMELVNALQNRHWVSEVTGEQVIFREGATHDPAMKPFFASFIEFAPPAEDGSEFLGVGQTPEEALQAFPRNAAAEAALSSENDDIGSDRVISVCEAYTPSFAEDLTVDIDALLRNTMIDNADQLPEDFDDIELTDKQEEQLIRELGQIIDARLEEWGKHPGDIHLRTESTALRRHVRLAQSAGGVTWEDVLDA